MHSQCQRMLIATHAILQHRCMRLPGKTSWLSCAADENYLPHLNCSDVWLPWYHQANPLQKSRKEWREKRIAQGKESKGLCKHNKWDNKRYGYRLVSEQGLKRLLCKMQVGLLKKYSNKMTNIQHTTQCTSTTRLHFEHYHTPVPLVWPKWMSKLAYENAT